MFGLLAGSCGGWRRAAGVILAWVVVGLVLYLTAPPLSDVTTNSQADFLPSRSESQRALELVAEKFPGSQGVPAIVVFHRPDGLSDADLATAAEVDAALQAEGAPPDIESVVSLSTTPPLAGSLLAPDRTTVMAIVTITGSPADPQFLDVLAWIGEQARARTDPAGLTVAVTGPAGIAAYATEVTGAFDFRITVFTILLVLALLLLIYRSPALALLPLVGVGWTVLMAQAVAALLTENFGLALNGQVTALMSVLMFGAGTDFTLFIVSRYREELRRQPDRWRAMRVSVQRVGPSIASSGGTTIVAMLALLLATFGSFQSMGPMLAMAMFLMVVSGLTLIPALTVLLGRAAFWPGRMQVSGTEHSRVWSRVATTVVRYPLATLAATLILLVAFAAGVSSTRSSFNLIDGFPDRAEAKVGAGILDEHFDAGELAPSNVVVRTANVDASLVDLDRVAEAVASVPGVARVTGPTRPTGDLPAVDAATLQAAIPQLPPALRAGPPPGEPAGAASAMGGPADADGQTRAVLATYLAGRRFVSPDSTTARLEVVMKDDPYALPAIERVSEIREVARRAATGSLDDAEVVVGGPTALQADARDAVNRDMAVVGPIVAVMIWLILLLLLRSPVAATYLLGSVLLSFLSAVGISVVIFQQVLGHPGLGYQNVVWMFIFLAALGADYNILIISRVREEIRTRGLVGGVRAAVAQTGGVITSAGLILAGTFSVLTTFPLRDIYQLGFAVALGVLIDTFIVRALFVPSIVLLLGRWNWWPSRLDAGAVAGNQSGLAAPAFRAAAASTRAAVATVLGRMGGLWRGAAGAVQAWLFDVLHLLGGVWRQSAPRHVPCVLQFERLVNVRQVEAAGEHLIEGQASGLAGDEGQRGGEVTGAVVGDAD